MSIVLSTLTALAALRSAVSRPRRPPLSKPPAYNSLRGGATTPDVDALADAVAAQIDGLPLELRRDEYRAQLSSIAEEAVADFAADDGAERARLERRIQNELDAAAARYREHAQRAVDAVAARLGAALGELRHEALLERWRVRVLQLGRVRAEFERSLDLAAAEARAAVAKLAAHYYGDAEPPSALLAPLDAALAARHEAFMGAWSRAGRPRRTAQRAAQLARIPLLLALGHASRRWKNRWFGVDPISIGVK